MKIQLTHSGQSFTTDLSAGISLASSLGNPSKEVKAWAVPNVDISPVQAGEWTGSVEQGSPVNFYNITFNPHGNGTHTEGVGHIDAKHQSLNTSLKQYHFIASFVSLEPIERNGDQVITLLQLQEKWHAQGEKALIIKTGDYPSGHDFTNTNPPYFEPELLAFIRQNGVEHFLTDLPSVDREEDGGALSGHHAFWGVVDDSVPTISELLAIPANLNEGLYLLNLQFPAFENDASPSRPVLFPLLASK